ncbi:GTP-binding protein rhb1 [Nadsonia fulvescens var. elongata DSM 6958]|uniref:GTP-binding protein rhb1 n=1 Tax=Nadsonia fulvescens var. elongata DSM 6958 TaxID=857566 RepID=A0A1E3PF62_9ASCO|nr:GTP-binding protein rhb1 [Nadsonia fulvescens var. elongata DSM 6958]
MPIPITRKIAVVGTRAVGKSSMTVQYVEDHFVESYYPTIENQFSKVVKYRGHEYDIEILDTAGQDEFSIMNEKHLIGVHGYVLVYSVTSRSSLEMLKIIREKILNQTGTEKFPAVLVGNKSDLHMQRQVEVEEGQEVAKEFGCAFVEASARHNDNVAKAFELLINEIEKTDNPKAEPTGEKCSIM